MCQWLRFLTAGGTIDGKRLVSEATLQEITRPHIAINDTLSYGLGWATYKWNGHTVVEHNGGSQGIIARLVSFVPDRRVGFAFLANTSPNYMTAIGNAGRLLWPLLLGEGAPSATVASTTPATSSPPGAVPADVATLPNVDELLAQMIAAYGWERNLRRHSNTEGSRPQGRPEPRRPGRPRHTRQGAVQSLGRGDVDGRGKAAWPLSNILRRLTWRPGDHVWAGRDVHRR